MPTYYVDDYDGKKNDDAVERETFNPVVEDAAETKVVEAPAKRPKKAASAKVETA